MTPRKLRILKWSVLLLWTALLILTARCCSSTTTPDFELRAEALNLD